MGNGRTHCIAHTASQTAAMASVEYNLRDVNCQGKLRLHCTYMYLRAVPIRAHSQNLHWVDGCVLLKNRKKSMNIGFYEKNFYEI